MEWFRRLNDWLLRRFSESRSGGAPRQQREVRGWMQAVQATHEHELSCDEVYALIDQFVEAVARGEDPQRFMPLVQRHLDMCPDCHEEYQMLLALVRGKD